MTIQETIKRIFSKKEENSKTQVDNVEKQNTDIYNLDLQWRKQFAKHLAYLAVCPIFHI